MSLLGGDNHAAIRTTSLTKHYGPVQALDGLSLDVPAGAMYGFLGPNGAGKTTTIKLLMGFIRPTSGRAEIFGHETWRDGVAARRDLGFLVQPDNLFNDMSGAAHLEYAAKLSGRSPSLQARLLDGLELSQEALRRRLGSYSKGMRQKLALTAAMQHDPSLLILDEPTDGLDPLIQRNFELLLQELHASGRTIFMSSHDLAEVERNCQRVAVVKGGRLVVEESVQNLKALQRRKAFITFATNGSAPMPSLPGVSLLEIEGNRVTVLIDGDVNPLIRALAGKNLADLTIVPPSLDDIFLEFYDETTAPFSAPIPDLVTTR